MRLRNNIAAFGWVVSLCFLAGCLAFTYILIRDGSAGIQIYAPDIPDHYSSWLMPLVNAVFWLGGFGAMNHLSKIPCVQVEVLPDGSVTLEKRFLFRKERMTVPSTEVTPAAVIEVTDSDGDPYYLVQLCDADGVAATIAESGDRARCNEICSRFNIATGRPCQN